MTQFKLNGWQKDSANSNDDSFSNFKPTLVKLGSSSSSEHIIPEYTNISNQLNLGSCVANATVDAFEILKGLQDKNSVTQLSRLFVYWNARVYTQDTDKDEGTQIRNAFDSLKRLGVCQESTWPYNTSKVFAQPPINAYKEGNDNTITSFYRIDANGDDQQLNDIETAIRANHPVVFGVIVSKAFTQDINLRESDCTIDAPKDSVGSHALVVTGVRTNANGRREFYIRNSWGMAWGFNGHCWFTEEYMKMAEDIWVPTNMDNLLV